MKSFSILSILAVASLVYADACPPVNANAAGSQNVGKAGAQFVTGQCTSDSNCASGCCVLQGSTPVCRNEPALSGGLKCGFSCDGAAAAAPAAPPAGNAAAAPAGGASIASLAASQSSLGFVTAACSTDSDCQQGCCAFNTGKCAGPAIAQTRDGGCGHGSPAPNCNVAKALGLSDCAPGAVNGNLQDPKIQAAAAFVSQLDNIPFTPSAAAAPAAAAPPADAAAAPAAAAPAAASGGACPAVDANAAGSQNVGKPGAQFVTGQCTSDANCASGCCVLQGSTPVCRNEPALSGGLKCGFSCDAGAAAAPAAPAAAPAAAAGGACPAVNANAAGSQNVGKPGAQFVTGQCTSDANCASGCCVLQGSTPVCRNEPALSGGLKCGFSCSGNARRFVSRKARLN